MTQAQIQMLRERIGGAVLDVQQVFRNQSPNDVVPEILAALLSLAAFIAKNNAALSLESFIFACKVAALEQWMDNDHT